MTPENFLQTLKDWNIDSSTIQHEAMFTTEQSRRLRQPLPGAHCKSLLLKNKKGDYILLIILHDTQVDIKAFADQMGVARLSFASPERLKEKLHLTPGSVTPFGLINNTDRDVQLVLDSRVMDHDILNFHPLINTMTTSITKENFLKFLKQINVDAKTLLIPSL